MVQSTITIPVQNVKTEFESWVYKYANALEADGKSVRNLKADRVDDTLDALLVNNSFDKRLKEVVSIMHDFGAVASASGNNTVVTFNTSGRWAGTVAAVLSLVKTYILDGMMVDWLNVTAPSEAAIYVAKLPQDATDIKVELYTKGAPQ